MIAFSLTAVVTLLGIRMYAKLRKTPLYVLIPLFLAVFIPCSIVVLVPIDLVSSSKHAKSSLFYLSEDIRLALWRVIYWLAFFLTWAVMPMLQSFMGSGYHSTLQRLSDAAEQNLKYQLVMLVAGLAGLVYVVFSAGLTMSSFKALVVALSHSYALVVALWLMGHGMVNLPRRYWNEARPGVLLKSYYRHATLANDRNAEAQTEYADVASEVLALASYNDGRYLEWIQAMIEEVEAGPGVPLNTSVNGGIRIERSMVNAKYLSTLNSRFKTARNLLIRHDTDWQKLLFEASKAEDLVRAEESRELLFRYEQTIFPPKIAYLMYGVIQPRLEKGMAMLSLILTVVVVWSEIVHGTKLSIVNLLVLHSSGIWQQIISSLVLGYMCAAAFSSLSRIRIHNFYALVYRHTDMESLLFYAMYACRLTVPLSYNFITMISSRESVFEDFLGKYINLTPLGKYFNVWLPRFILVPMIFTLFHVYDKVRELSTFGLSFDEDETDKEEGGSVVEGRELINRALSNPEYRYALRHPNISAVAEQSRSSVHSGGSSSYTANSAAPTNTRTSASHLNQLGGSRSAHAGRSKRQLQLGGGQIKRTRLQDQESIVAGAKRQIYEDEDSRGFFSKLGGKLLGHKEEDQESSGLLPRWSDRSRYDNA